MDVPVTFLADTPGALDDGDQPVSEIQIAKVGRFRDPRYGDFAITRADFAKWLAAFETVNRGRIPVDFDHASERGGSTEAAGWVTALEARGDQLWGKVQWTQPGAEAVRDRRYLYISPAYRSNVMLEGKPAGPALTSVALTNKPYLKDMATVSLSEHGFAEQVEGEFPAVADSQPSMTDIAKITAALELDEGADETAILDAIGALKTTPEPEPVVLDELAKAEGKIVLDSDAVLQLRQDASEGKAAMAELRQAKFNTAFERALSEGRVDAKPETRQLHAALYDAKPDETLRLLDSAPVIASMTPKGSNDHDTTGTAPANVDQDSFELDQKVAKYAAEHSIDITTRTGYVKALDAVLAVEA